MHTLRIAGIPAWIDPGALLGPDISWRRVEDAVEATASRATAADIDARLRGVGLGGRALEVRIQPPVGRTAVRQARLDDARRRRDKTPGFLRAGAELDAEGRLSLTPESLALDLAQRIGVHSIVDVCCGVGGNAIAFARAGSVVEAIEIDATRLEMARHNARIYGVADRIHFHEGDAIALLPTLHAEAVFLDPPWGGEGWNRKRTTLSDVPLLAALASGLDRFPAAFVKAPPSFDPGELPTYTPRAVFGAAAGDALRVKFLVLARGAR